MQSSGYVSPHYHTCPSSHIDVHKQFAFAVWNTHARITRETALQHIADLSALTPALTISSPYITSSPAPPAPGTPPDLDTPDELAVRALLLGILHRTLGSYGPSRAFLADAHGLQHKIGTSTWVGGVAMFEMAVLDLKEAEKELDGDGEGAGKEKGRKERWAKVLKGANEKLDKALALATQQVDLSSRLDSRIVMLRDEIALKKEMLAAES